MAHLLMGIYALIAAPFFWPKQGVNWGALAWPLVGNIAGYTLGQIAQIAALRHAEASRVGPLMTSKLLVSGVLVLWFGQPVGGSSTHVTILQWCGVAACLVAGVSINRLGGKMHAKAVIGIAVAAVAFSCSDFCINLMIGALLQQPELHDQRFQASLVAGLLSYLTTGIMAIPLLRFYGSRKAEDWAEAVPFSMVWLGSLVGLYAAFARVGILLGTILQCTRGFITIIFAWAIIHLGHHHIEPHTHRNVLVRRLAAGILMFAGTAMYLMRDGPTFQKMLDAASGSETRK